MAEALDTGTVNVAAIDLWLRTSPQTIEQTAAAVVAALQAGLLLAQATRDVSPLEAAFDLALDRIRCLAAQRPDDL